MTVLDSILDGVRADVAAREALLDFQAVKAAAAAGARPPDAPPPPHAPALSGHTHEDTRTPAQQSRRAIH
ncbi:hypothetical protein ACFXO7_26430, partial [Nocardia tengchongensis]